MRGLWKGDVSEAATLWWQEEERAKRAELAVRDLEERIREAGPGGAPLEFEAYDQEVGR